VLALLLAACASATPSSPPGSGSQAGLAGSQTGSAPAPTPRPYSGAPERGPCSDAHQCTLRDNCGCSCEGVLVSAPAAAKCEETCANKEACKGYSLICDRGTQTCGAIPPAPKP
jgi:hypothetical protein